VHNATDLPVFRALAEMPDRAMVFAGAMKWHAMLPGFSVQYLAAAFPWGSGGELTVVDVGGGLGHVSRALADHNPAVKCIVEDSPDVVVQGQGALPADLRRRISFQAHDFFQEQPVKGADVYLLRLVLHDWSDKYSKMIIKALIPALKPGAKVVINDRVIPGRGEAPYLAEREARSVILHMHLASKTDKRVAQRLRHVHACLPECQRAHSRRLDYAFQ
jgi:O-methyltransferase domain